jgi:hypothetical protein
VTAICPGETVLGDGWRIDRGDAVSRLFVVDGTGHGPLAAEAAEAALKLFTQHAEQPPAVAIDLLHRGLASGRGGAIAIAAIDHAARQVRYAGLGNIAGVLVDGDQVRHMVSMNGVAGHSKGRTKEFNYPYTTPQPIVILHSDGLSARWDLRNYPGLASCHASVIAGVLHRDHSRKRDDATVLVVKAVSA